MGTYARVATRLAPACLGDSLLTLWTALHTRDEIDEIHLKLNPVVIGAGTPLTARHSRKGPAAVN